MAMSMAVRCFSIWTLFAWSAHSDYATREGAVLLQVKSPRNRTGDARRIAREVRVDAESAPEAEFASRFGEGAPLPKPDHKDAPEPTAVEVDPKRASEQGEVLLLAQSTQPREALFEMAESVLDGAGDAPYFSALLPSPLLPELALLAAAQPAPLGEEDRAEAGDDAPYFSSLLPSPESQRGLALLAQAAQPAVETDRFVDDDLVEAAFGAMREPTVVVEAAPQRRNSAPPPSRSEVVLLAEAAHVRAAFDGASDKQSYVDAALALWSRVTRLPAGLWPEQLQDAARSCAFGVVAAVLCIALLTTYQHHSTPLECRGNASLQALGSMFLVIQVAGIFYPLTILDSLDLARRMGHDAGFSGRSLGTFFLGKFVGHLAVWALQRANPDGWLRWSKCVIVFCLSLTMLGLALYSIAVMRSYAKDGTADAAGLLLLSRAACGFGLGGIQQVTTCTVARLWDPACRPAQMVTLSVVWRLVDGVGAILSALAHDISNGDIVSAWSCIVALNVIAVWVALTYPSLDHCEGSKAALQAAPAVDEVDPASLESWVAARRRVVAGAICISTLKGYINAALGAICTMILEDQFHWHMRSIGFALGFTYMACLPAKQLHNLVEGRLGIASGIRFCMASALVGTLAMAVGGEASNAWILLLGMCIATPAVCLAEGLSQGVMQQNLLPQGWRFADAAHAVLYRSAGQNLLRFPGPWLSRQSLELGGLMGVNCSQLLVTGLFVASFELLVAPRVLEPRKQQS